MAVEIEYREQNFGASKKFRIQGRVFFKKLGTFSIYEDWNEGDSYISVAEIDKLVDPGKPVDLTKLSPGREFYLFRNGARLIVRHLKDGL